jgi:hypothetical protein
MALSLHRGGAADNRWKIGSVENWEYPRSPPVLELLVLVAFHVQESEQRIVAYPTSSDVL